MDVHDRLGTGPGVEANAVKHRETVDDDPAADQRGNQPADHGDSMEQPHRTFAPRKPGSITARPAMRASAFVELR